MRAGSGLTHEERLTGPDAEGFQIWFEPYLRDSLKQNPACRQYRPDSFPVTRIQGGLVKTMIGGSAPTDLSVDVRMLDIQILAGNEAQYELKSGRRAAVLAVRSRRLLCRRGKPPISSAGLYGNGYEAWRDAEP